MYGTPDSELSNKTDNKIELDWGNAGTLIPTLPLGTWLVSRAPPYTKLKQT
jgi:hypothetical protein